MDRCTGVIGTGRNFQDRKHENRYDKEVLFSAGSSQSVMLQAVFGALIYSILGLSTSIYVGKITDYVLVDKNINLLNLMGVIMLVILLLRTFIGAMKSILALKTGQRIDAALI